MTQTHPIPTAPLITPEEAYGIAAALKRADFRWLWLAQVGSQLADKFLMYALLVFVSLKSGSASSASILMVAYTLPSVFLSTAAGVYADRHDKRVLMLGTNLSRAVIVLLVPVISAVTSNFGGASWWWLIPITLVFSSAGQVFAPAEAASIPSLVTRKQIMAATSLFMTTVVLTIVIGVPLAALSIGISELLPFYLGAGLFIVAGIFVWRIKTPLVAARQAKAEPPDLLRELREGLAILRGVAALRMALIVLTVALVVVFTVFALGPTYMVTVLQLQPSQTYIVLVPATLGIIAVAGFLGQRAPGITKRSRIVVIALIGAGVCLAGIGIIPHAFATIHASGFLIAVTILLALLFGCALGSLLIPAFTVLQENTTEENRGRIFGGIFAVINAAIAVPILAAGFLSDAFHSAEVPFAGLGVILIIGGFLAGKFASEQLGALDAGSRREVATTP